MIKTIKNDQSVKNDQSDQNYLKWLKIDQID